MHSAFHHLAYAADVGGHHRGACGQCLHQDVWQTFILAGQNHGLRCVHPRRHRFGPDFADKTNPVFNAQIPGQNLQISLLRASTYQNKNRALGLKPGKGRHQNIDTFYRMKPGDAADDRNIYWKAHIGAGTLTVLDRVKFLIDPVVNGRSGIRRGAHLKGNPALGVTDGNHVICITQHPFRWFKTPIFYAVQIRTDRLHHNGALQLFAQTQGRMGVGIKPGAVNNVRQACRALVHHAFDRPVIQFSVQTAADSWQKPAGGKMHRWISSPLLAMAKPVSDRLVVPGHRNHHLNLS